MVQEQGFYFSAIIFSIIPVSTYNFVFITCDKIFLEIYFMYPIKERMVFLTYFEN